MGDTVNDFTLYKLDGTAVNLTTVIQQTQKPVLLVAGSYTCPVFRDRMTELNQMSTFYGSQLNIYIVYVVEAHPKSPHVSPYSGTVWVTSQNQQQGVLYGQPTTYGQRKQIVNTMTTSMTILPEILLDGPCNPWWSTYGPAPNNAYLIDVNGKVRSKNGWFNKAPDNLWCSIDSLLGTNSGNCTIVSDNGSFSYSYEGDSVAWGAPLDVLTVHGWLKNTSTENAVVDLIKVEKNIPVDWQTAFCTDVCLPPWMDSTRVTIPPGDSASLIFYFYTDSVPASGNVKVLMKNANDTSNQFNYFFYSSTDGALKLRETDKREILLFPNPSTGIIHIRSSSTLEQLDVLNTMGQVVQQFYGEQPEFDITGLQSGLYFMRLKTESGIEIKRLMKVGIRP